MFKIRTSLKKETFIYVRVTLLNIFSVSVYGFKTNPDDERHLYMNIKPLCLIFIKTQWFNIPQCLFFILIMVKGAWHFYLTSFVYIYKQKILNRNVERKIGNHLPILGTKTFYV